MNEEVRQRFIKLLVVSGVMKEAVLSPLAEGHPADLPRILHEGGYCPGERLLPVLEEVYRVPSVNVRDEEVDGEALRMVPGRLCWNARALPLRVEDGHLVVAFADPDNFQHVDEVQAAAGMPVTVRLGLEADILAVLEEEKDGTRSVDELVADILEDDPTPTIAAPRSNIDEDDETSDAASETEDSSPLRVSTQSEKRSPAVRQVDKLLDEAVRRQAGHVYLMPMPDEKVHVRLKLKDSIVETRTYPKDLHPRVVNRLRVLSNLLGADRRDTQCGTFRVLQDGTPNRFDVLICPGEAGEAVMIFLNDPSGIATELRGAKRKCAGCGESLQDRWAYCPLCGKSAKDASAR